MKKLIALLLSVLLALTSMAPAYAAKPYLENQNFSIEASIDAFYYTHLTQPKKLEV